MEVGKIDDDKFNLLVSDNFILLKGVDVLEVEAIKNVVGVFDEKLVVKLLSDVGIIILVVISEVDCAVVADGTTLVCVVSTVSVIVVISIVLEASVNKIK